MKLVKTLVAAATVTVLAASMSTASAGDKFGFKSFSYAGSACRSGSVDYTITNDGKTLTALFDDYEVEVGGGNRSSKRKACNMGINIHVPQGFAVGLVDVDYRGYVDLPHGAKATLKRSYFFSGGNGPQKTKNWKGSVDKNYLVRDKMATFTSTWSKCGRDVILRANTSMKVKTKHGKEASAGVDSVDFKGRLVYNLRWKKCH